MTDSTFEIMEATLNDDDWLYVGGNKDNMRNTRCFGKSGRKGENRVKRGKSEVLSARELESGKSN